MLYQSDIFHKTHSFYTFKQVIRFRSKCLKLGRLMVAYVILSKMYKISETRHLGAAKRARTIRAQQKGRRTKRAQGKRAQSKKGAEQKECEITMLRHRYIQGRNFFR